jgi:hypothetical protein
MQLFKLIKIGPSLHSRPFIDCASQNHRDTFGEKLFELILRGLVYCD